MSDTTETDNIYSPHNACMFRADCRKAEAEIARLREYQSSRHRFELSDAAIDAAVKGRG